MMDSTNFFQWTPDPAEVAEVKSCMAIPSTGNAEQDDAHLQRSAENEVRIRHGYCPNGPQCQGKLVAVQATRTLECPLCKFTQYNRTL